MRQEKKLRFFFLLYETYKANIHIYMLFVKYASKTKKCDVNWHWNMIFITVNDNQNQNRPDDRFWIS